MRSRILLLTFAFCLLPFTARGARAATINLTPGGDLQTAVNSAGANGMVILAQGTYKVSKTVILPAGITLRGTTTITAMPVLDITSLVGVAIPSWNYVVTNESIISGSGIRALQGSDGMTIENVSFDGSALWHPGTALNWNIMGCNFAAKTKEAAHPTIIEVNTFINLNLHDCLIHEVPGAGIDALIYCYPAQGWISNCDFYGGNDAIHITTTNTPSPDYSDTPARDGPPCGLIAFAKKS